MSDQELKRLLSLMAQAVDRVEADMRQLGDDIRQLNTRIDAQGAVLSNLIATARRADIQHANGRLQQQAALNAAKTDIGNLLAILTTPAALAGVAPRATLDAARQIKRQHEIAATGKDPAAQRRREDDVTIATIRVKGVAKKFRLRKSHAAALLSIAGTTIGWFLHHLLPLLQK